MKLNIGTIVGINKGLLTFKNDRIPWDLCWDIDSNLLKTDPIVKQFAKTRQDIIIQYADKDPEGKPTSLSEVNQQKANAELESILIKEEEIDLVELDYDDLRNAIKEIAPETLNLLRPIVVKKPMEVIKPKIVKNKK